MIIRKIFVVLEYACVYIVDSCQDNKVIRLTGENKIYDSINDLINAINFDNIYSQTPEVSVSKIDSIFYVIQNKFDMLVYLNTEDPLFIEYGTAFLTYSVGFPIILNFNPITKIRI